MSNMLLSIWITGVIQGTQVILHKEKYHNNTNALYAQDVKIPQDIGPEKEGA